MGRPSDYSPEIAARICDLLASGESLRSICAADDMPAQSSVFLWLQKHSEFSEQYARAREAQMELWAGQIVEIADETNDDVQRARLRVDTRKWLMSKLAPKKYGDKVTNEHTGPDGGPVQIERIERAIIDPPNRDSESLPPAA